MLSILAAFLQLSCGAELLSPHLGEKGMDLPKPRFVGFCHWRHLPSVLEVTWSKTLLLSPRHCHSTASKTVLSGTKMEPRSGCILLNSQAQSKSGLSIPTQQVTERYVLCHLGDILKRDMEENVLRRASGRVFGSRSTFYLVTSQQRPDVCTQIPLEQIVLSFLMDEWMGWTTENPRETVSPKCTYITWMKSRASWSPSVNPKCRILNMMYVRQNDSRVCDKCCFYF